MTDASHLLLTWCDCFKRGNDFVAWGQLVEAADEYNRLFKQIKQQISDPDNELFPAENKKLLYKIAALLEQQSKLLQNAHPGNISLDELKQVYTVLDDIRLDKKGGFPIQIELPEHYNNHCEYELTVDEFLNDKDEMKVRGTLLPRIPYEAECHRLTIRIIKIGLKDPSEYIDPFVTVSIKDINGTDITPSQDTPASKIKENNYIVFANDVELQCAIEKLPKGSAVFFEFKHFKPKKKLVSLKCWSFMELDELKPGPACIELYKKPMDSCRTKINLLTIKPLYLHIHLTINDGD